MNNFLQHTKLIRLTVYLTFNLLRSLLNSIITLVYFHYLLLYI